MSMYFPKNSPLSRFNIIKNSASGFNAGISGVPELARDKENNNKLVFSKHANPWAVKFDKQVSDLHNEAQALSALDGYHVPLLIATSERYLSERAIPYLFMELLEPVNSLEKSHVGANSIPLLERAEILIQLYETLAQAHSLGFINGDVDFKHLYWFRNDCVLKIIDWGNSIHDLKDDNDFMPDLFQSVDVIKRVFPRADNLLEEKMDLGHFPVDLPSTYNFLINNDIKDDLDIYDLLDETKLFYLREAGLFSEKMKLFVPEWVNNFSENSWMGLLEDLFTLAPHYPLVQVAMEHKKTVAGVIDASRLEEMYRRACLRQNWDNCIKAIDILVEGNYFEVQPALWLRELLVLIQEDRQTIFEDYIEALADVVWEFLNFEERDKVYSPIFSGNIGMTLVETLAWRLYPNLAQTITQSHGRNSFFVAFEKIKQSIIDDITIYEKAPDSYDEVIEFLESLLNDIENYYQRFQRKSSNVSLDVVLRDYVFVDRLISKLYAYYEQTPLLLKELGLKDLHKRASEIISGIRSIIHEDGQPDFFKRNFYKAKKIAEVWEIDRECWSFYQLWKEFSQSVLVARPVVKDKSKYWRYEFALSVLLNIYQIPGLEKTITELSVFIKHPEYNLHQDYAFFLRGYIKSLKLFLPFGWQMDQDILELFCLLSVWSDILRFPNISNVYSSWLQITETTCKDGKLDLSRSIQNAIKSRKFGVTPDFDNEPSYDALKTLDKPPIFPIDTKRIYDIPPKYSSYNTPDVPRTGINNKKSREHHKLYDTGKPTRNLRDGFLRFASSRFFVWGLITALLILSWPFLGRFLIPLYISPSHVPVTHTPTSVITHPTSTSLSPTDVVVSTPASILLTPPEPSQSFSPLFSYFSNGEITTGRPYSEILIPDSANKFFVEGITLADYLNSGGAALFYYEPWETWLYQVLREDQIWKGETLSLSPQIGLERIEEFEAINMVISAAHSDFSNAKYFGVEIQFENDIAEVRLIPQTDGRYKVQLYLNDTEINSHLKSSIVINSNNVMRFYILIDKEYLHVYFLSEPKERFDSTPRSNTPYIGSVPITGNVKDIRLSSLGRLRTIIDEITIYGKWK